MILLLFFEKKSLTCKGDLENVQDMNVDKAKLNIYKIAIFVEGFQFKLNSNNIFRCETKLCKRTIFV